jgi:hypothetical protein
MLSVKYNTFMICPRKLNALNFVSTETNLYLAFVFAFKSERFYLKQSSNTFMIPHVVTQGEHCTNTYQISRFYVRTSTEIILVFFLNIAPYFVHLLQLFCLNSLLAVSFLNPNQSCSEMISFSYQL